MNHKQTKKKFEIQNNGEKIAEADLGVDVRFPHVFGRLESKWLIKVEPTDLKKKIGSNIWVFDEKDNSLYPLTMIYFHHRCKFPKNYF